MWTKSRLLFVLLFGWIALPLVAQKVISTPDFEINLPEGWEYHCEKELGSSVHHFKNNSMTYTLYVFSIPVHADVAFQIFLPDGTKYVDMYNAQISQTLDGTEFQCKWIQEDKDNPALLGSVYTAVRNDKTLAIQEIEQKDTVATSESLLPLFRWPEVIPLPLAERVDKFCYTINELMEHFTAGLHFKHLAEEKKIIIKYWYQTPEEEAKALTKGKREKKEKSIQKILSGYFPILQELGKEGYTFQLSRYLMNGELDIEVIYHPEDYKHLLEEE